MDKIARDLLIKLSYEQKFNTVSQQIHSASDIDDIFIKLKDHILELLDADRITIYAISDYNPKRIYSKVKTGGEIKEIHVLLNKNSIAGYAGTTLKMVNIKNAYNTFELSKIDPELKFDSSWDKITGYITKQVLAMPILFEGELTGVIQLINKKNGGIFTEEDEFAIQEIANVLGIAFYNKTRMFERQTKFSYLLLSNYLTRKELAKAVDFAREHKTDVESILINRFKVSKHLILKSLSRFYNCRIFDFGSSTINPDLIKGLSHGYLKKNLCIPIEKRDDTVVILTSDPSNIGSLQEIMLSVGAQANEVCVALKEDIMKVLQSLIKPESKQITSTAKDILDELDGREVGEGEEGEEEEDLSVDESDSMVVQLVNKVFDDAYRQGVSDIHIEPYGKQLDTEIRFRIDGKCVNYLKVPRIHTNAFISRIKILSGLDISDKRKPQDGRVKFKASDNQGIELRVATVPTVGGNEDVVLRILPSGGALPMDKMGFSDRNLREFKEMIVKPYGIILVVGPTGSGKTTTLHASLGYINKPDKKIWTAEDPVEVSQYGLRQVQVMPKIGYTFAAAMRAFLRADPDVIMVGEMRDVETTAIGIEASLTGHLVFSTLHTNSAPEAVVRLLDMGMDPYNFSDALLGILAQRLVRRLCNNCKKAYHPSKEEFDELKRVYGEKFNERIKVNYQNLTLSRSNGCDSCGNSGYKGRVGIHELLVGSHTVKKLIQKKAPVEKIRDVAMEEGMSTLLQDGVEKVIKGFTDLKEVRSVCIK